MSQVFPIVGVPRSGTTLLAEILHPAVPMGLRWKPWAEPGWHPGGVFIDAEFNEAHVGLTGGLRGAGVKVNEQYLPAYRELVARREAGAAKWGVKDHLLPFVWAHFLNACRGSVCLLKTRRCPDESIASYAARSGIPDLRSRQELEPWFEACDAIWSSFQGPKLEVDFHRLTDPASSDLAVKELSDFVGCQLSAATIKPEWRRFRVTARLETPTQPGQRQTTMANRCVHLGSVLQQTALDGGPSWLRGCALHKECRTGASLNNDGRKVCGRCPDYEDSGQPLVEEKPASGVPTARDLSRECFHLGDVLDNRGCNCPGKWLRECELHGQCALADPAAGVACCATCADYTAEPP